MNATQRERAYGLLVNCENTPDAELAETLNKIGLTEEETAHLMKLRPATFLHILRPSLYAIARAIMVKEGMMEADPDEALPSYPVPFLSARFVDIARSYGMNHQQTGEYIDLATQGRISAEELESRVYEYETVTE